MKVGDKVLCKKTMYDTYMVNKEYSIAEIGKIFNYSQYLDTEYKPNKPYDEKFNNFHMLVMSEDGKSYIFYENNHTPPRTYLYYVFKEYFYTEKEVRKLKLSKIKNKLNGIK